MLLAVEDWKCIRARRMLSLALDGEAAASEVLVATTHIASCEGCRQYAERVVALTNELRSVGISAHHQKDNASERGRVMKGKIISRLLLLAAVSATIGVTPATAGQVGQKSNLSRLCLERAGGCPKAPPVVRAKQKGQPIQPQSGFDSRGEPAWRSGTWLMY